MSEIQVNTINEYTGANGVTIDGVLLKDNKLASGTGNILQVVNATDTTVASYTPGAGGTSQLGSLQLSITPSSTSSSIFLMTSLMIGGNNRYFEMNFFRDSTRLGDTNTATGNRRNIFHQAGLFDANDEQFQMIPFQMHYLDSPASTSSITYSVRTTHYSTASIYYNRPSDDTDGAFIHRARSVITAMEVGG
jgi:hypothetical protein